jgi:hypothetical protein
MNRRATAEPTKLRRPYKRPPKVLAKLELFTTEQRRLHDTIRYFHGSMWPVFRALGIKQSSDGTIYEAVQWGRVCEPKYSVVRWNPDGRGFCWTEHRSSATALRTLRSVR